MNKPELSLSIIEQLKAQGQTEAEIARLLGVTRQAINYHVHTYNGTRTPRQEALKHFPWTVPSKHTQCQPYRFMRDHAEYMATGGKGMDEKKLGRLRTFYSKVQAGYVIEYDPNLPPQPGVSLSGGWAYRERQDTDGDLLVRVNEYTVITDEGKLLWRLPPRLP